MAWAGTGAASRLAPVGARLGTGVRRQRSLQARRPSRPPLPSPTPAAGAHARRRPGRSCGTGRRSGRWIVPSRYLGDPRGRDSGGTGGGRGARRRLPDLAHCSPRRRFPAAAAAPGPLRCNSKGVRVARARSNRSPAGAWKAEARRAVAPPPGSRLGCAGERAGARDVCRMYSGARGPRARAGEPAGICSAPV